MKVLYLTCYPEKEFEQIQNKGKILSFAAQKFNKLYVKGLCLNGHDVEVLLCGALEDNILIESYAGRTIRYQSRQFKGGFLNRQVQKNHWIKQTIEEYSKIEPQGIIVIDALQSMAYEFTRFAKRSGIKIITLVTDFYSDVLCGKSTLLQRVKHKLTNYFFNKQLEKSDLLILLAEAMKERVPKNVDSLVINGIVDYDIEREQRNLEKSKTRICMYTGDIRKMYGAQNLIEAFLLVGAENTELHLYGFGMENYPDLQEILRKNPQIKYLGTKTNKEIVKLQKEADLLINPRLITGAQEYIKYSFPSKNIEYMASGTPMITTKLPCITKEYNDYVYFFEDDSVLGMEKTLRYCFSLTDNELRLKGKRAQDFIFTYLNNKKVVKEILEVVQSNNK